MNRAHTRALICVAICLTLAGVATADTVTLTNGREVYGCLVEETKDYVRLRTPGGYITIPKDRVATFTEDHRWGEDYLEIAPAPNQEPGAEPAPTTSERWWAKGVSDERIAELTPLRDQLLAELKELGPTREELERAIALSPADTKRLERMALNLGYHRRQGSANLRRRNALFDLLGEFGPRAIPGLIQQLREKRGNQWLMRMGSRGLAFLAQGAKAPKPPSLPRLHQTEGPLPEREIPYLNDGRTTKHTRAAPRSFASKKRPALKPLTLSPEDIQRLMYHFDAPAVLIELLGYDGDPDAPFVRQEANAALEAITRASQGYRVCLAYNPRSPEDLEARRAEERARKAWESWWAKTEREWLAKEDAQDERQSELRNDLERVRQGLTPEKVG